MFNNILLTGLPHCGKTTLLETLVAPITYKQGFLTREVQENRKRTGFEIVAAPGTKTLFASVNFSTPHRVSRYGVDVEVLDKILPPLFSFTQNDVLYIDEIAQMELFSQKFEELVLAYANAPNLFIGTLSVVYSNSFTDQLRKRTDTEVIEVTPESRERVLHLLRQRI